MNLPDFAAFDRQSRAAGYDEVLERRWPPNTVLDTHTHAFDVEALVIEGEMWLTVGDDTLHLQRGQRFTLARQVAHAERYGAHGAAYWVARRNPR